MDYVSLHTHSTFSYGDGFGTVQQHVKRVADLGMTAMALTEHGNTSSHVQLEKWTKHYGIKPIYGIEAYVSPPGEKLKTHLILLARNEIGYQNLNRIVTASYADERAGRFPTVYWSRLEQYSEGITVLSGCSDSELSCTLLGGKSYGDKRTEPDYEAALAVAERYWNIFGNYYFLEVQRFPRLQRTCLLNKAFEQIGQQLGIGLIGTCDVHYPEGTDNHMQTLLHAAHRGSTVEATEASWEYDILLTYPNSDGEMFADLENTGLSSAAANKALMNTKHLAAQIDSFDLPRSERIRYPINNKDWEPWNIQS
jgi:DNA polymerase-3 subunit alpha